MYVYTLSHTHIHTHVHMYIIKFVLGGGSALLPLPISPVTLDQLVHLTTLLSRKGASISELNIVRKQLELLKGGGLARAVFPARVSNS